MRMRRSRSRRRRRRRRRRRKKKKKKVGSPGLPYVKQVDRNRAADSYRAMGRVACYSCRWKGGKQSEE